MFRMPILQPGLKGYLCKTLCCLQGKARLILCSLRAEMQSIWTADHRTHQISMHSPL